MSTKPKVSLETTIPRDFTAWRSRDLVMAANQEITLEWWSRRKRDFEFFVSQVVIKEYGAGDPDAAKRRLEFLRPFPLLDISDEVESLAAKRIVDVPLPPKAQADALHIAVAAVNEMNYLVTWNCTHTHTHIANATLRSKIEKVCRSQGYEPPVVCTPQEMLEEEDQDA